MDDIFKSNQIGGGTNNESYLVSPFTILKKNNKQIIIKLIDNLVNNNFNGAKFICQENFTLKIKN